TFRRASVPPADRPHSAAPLHQEYTANSYPNTLYRKQDKLSFEWSFFPYEASVTHWFCGEQRWVLLKKLEMRAKLESRARILLFCLSRINLASDRFDYRKNHQQRKE